MKVKFIPNNVEVEIKPNESVLKVAHDNGIHIKSVCKGVPSCAECKIQIADGDFNVFPPTSVELNLIGTAHFVDHSRLACQLKCFGDVTIDLSEQIEKASRNLGSKRPRGSRAALMGDDFDPGHSKAVQGSIILQEAKAEDFEEDEVEQRPQQQQQRRDNRQDQRSGRPNHRPDNRPNHNRNQKPDSRNNKK